MTDNTSAEEIQRQVLIGQALDLKIGGANFREIARTLKIGVATAHKYVSEALEDIRDENEDRIDVLRRIEVARLDAMLLKLWKERDKPRTADTIIRLLERKHRLQGLDVGKGSGDEPPPPPPTSQLPAAIHITLVAPDGTKLSGSGTLAPPGETKAPAVETEPPNGGTSGQG